MKKSFEYDQTKYDPSAPKKTEEFLTADGVKTLTTDANDGAVLIQDEVDEDSLNPVTGAAVAAAIEAGGGGGGGTEEVFIAKYNTTTWEAVLEAYNAGKVIFLEVTDASIPYPYRLTSTAQIPLAAIRTGATGKCAVFIGSSLGSIDGTGENTSWNVYILGSNDRWTTQAGKIYPSFTSSDFNKVLSVVNNGNNFPVLQWTAPLPAFDPSTDVGKVLQVTANGLAWVSLT